MRTLLLPLTFLLSLASLSAVDLSFATVLNYGQDNKKLADLAYLGFIVDAPVSQRGSVFLQEAVRFEDTGRETGSYNKNIHWDANLAYAFHIAGREHFIDPYLTFGAGCSGAVFFDERARDWQTRTQLVIFPEAGAGVSLRFEDFVLGGNVRGQLLPFNPSPLRTYEQLPVAVALSFGVHL